MKAWTGKIKFSTKIRDYVSLILFKQFILQFILTYDLSKPYIGAKIWFYVKNYCFTEKKLCEL